MGIGGHIHVEVITEKITFPVRVPSPVTVRLRIMASAIAGRAAFILTITDPFFSLLCSSTDRGAITSKRQMVWIDHAFMDEKIQKLLLIEMENKKNGFSGFSCSVPTEEEFWKQRWKSNGESYRLSFSSWEVSF